LFVVQELCSSDI